MPVYNGEPYLREALRSLLQQTHRTIELILSDNASTDSTEAVCREIARQDSRVRYFRQDANIGAAANFEFVLRQARGALFMWAACDDIWDTDWIAALAAVLAANPGAIAYGTVHTIDEAGHPFSHIADGRQFEFAQRQPRRRQLAYYLEYEGFGKANPVYALMPRELLAAHFSRETFGRPFGDCVLLFSLLAHASLLSCANVSHYKRIHQSSASAPAATPIRRRRLTEGLRRLARAVGWTVKAAVAYHAAGGSSHWIVIAFALPKAVIFLVLHAVGARLSSNGATERR